MPNCGIKVKLISQKTFTCSKSTIEKLEKGMKHIQSKQFRHKNDAIDKCLLELLSNTS